MESDVCVICLEGEGQLVKFCRCCYLAHLQCLQSYINYEAIQANNVKKCACGRNIDKRVLHKILIKERIIDAKKIVPVLLILAILATTLAILLSSGISESNEGFKSFCGWINYICKITFYICSNVIFEIVNYSICIANWVNTTAFPIIWNCMISSSEYMYIVLYTISTWVIIIGKEVNNILFIFYPFVIEWVTFISGLIANWIISFFQTIVMLLKNNSTYLLEISQFILESLYYTLESILKLILSASKYSTDFFILYGPILYNKLSLFIINLLNCFRYMITFIINYIVTYSPMIYECLYSLFVLIFGWLKESTQDVSYWVLNNGPKVYDSLSTSTLMLIGYIQELSIIISNWVLEVSQCTSSLIFIIGEVSSKFILYIGEILRSIFIDTVPAVVAYVIDYCQYFYNKLILIYQIFQYYFLEGGINIFWIILEYVYIAIGALKRTIHYLIEEYSTILIKYFYVILDYFIIFGTKTILILSNITQWSYSIVLTIFSYILLFFKHSSNCVHSIVVVSVNYLLILLFEIGSILYNCGNIFGTWIISVIKITFDSIVMTGPSLFEWILLSVQFIYYWLLSVITITFNCIYIICKNTFSSVLYMCDIATSDEVFSSKVLELCSHITSKWLISLGQVITDWMVSIIQISGNFVFTIMQFTFTTLTDILSITFNWLQLLLEISTKAFTN